MKNEKKKVMKDLKGSNDIHLDKQKDLKGSNDIHLDKQKI